MTLDTNDSIRYLMNEMDPTEAIQFERELEQNPDLRIDIESMRRAAERLQQTPVFSAPQTILNEAASLASQHAQHRKRLSIRRRTLQAAAVLTFIIAPAVYMNQSTSESAQKTGVITDSKPSSPWVDQNESIRLAVTGVSSSTSNNINTTLSGRTEGGIAQSVRNASPTFFLTMESDKINEKSASMLDSIYQESFRKLRPIQQEIQAPSLTRDLQLTGSGRN